MPPKQQQQHQDAPSLLKDQSNLSVTDNQNSEHPQNSTMSEKNDENITEKVTKSKQPPAESHATTLPKISPKITPESLTNTILAAIAEARAKGSTPSLPAPEQEDRRQAHILSEKKRREHINIGFEHLRSILPNCNGTSDSKATVLLKAIAYIEKLQFENSFLKQNHQQHQSSKNGGEPFSPIQHSLSKSSLDISSSNMVKQHYLGQYKRVYSFPRPPLLSTKSLKETTDDSPVSIPGYNAPLSTDDNYQNSEPNPESEEYSLAASLSMLRNNSSPSSVS